MILPLQVFQPGMVRGRTLGRADEAVTRQFITAPKSLSSRKRMISTGKPGNLVGAMRVLLRGDLGKAGALQGWPLNSNGLRRYPN